MLIPCYGFVTYEDDKKCMLHQYKSQKNLSTNDW
jgi:hypothetical protein